MLESIGKNLWLLLTIVIPGMSTYGAWRGILLLEPSTHLTKEALKQLDDSSLVTTSVIVAIGLLQQALAIVVEACLTLLAKASRKKWPMFYGLFCERFALAAARKLDEEATRIIGNFFLSTNICIGLGLLLLYFLGYEAMDPRRWVPVSLMVLLGATFVSAVFRMFNAEWVIRECRKRRPKQ